MTIEKAMIKLQMQFVISLIHIFIYVRKLMDSIELIFQICKQLISMKNMIKQLLKGENLKNFT